MVSIYPISSFSKDELHNYRFDCEKAKEYESFLKEKALALDEKCISKTFLVIYKETEELVGYFSLSADTVKLTLEEKNNAELSEVSFMSLPAIKVGKLAVNKRLSKKAQHKGYGSFILDIADTFAYEMLEKGVACRFVTVDADIEYYPDTPQFYEKNGFVVNQTRKRKGTDKTVSMRRDIFHE